MKEYGDEEKDGKIKGMYLQTTKFSGLGEGGR